MSRSLGWVGWLHGDTALGWSDLDVSSISPGGTPGVLDEEVLLSALSSVSDGEDTVVESGAASAGDDTGVVSLEDVLVGLDSDGNWSLGEGSLELSTRGVSGDILVGLDLTNTLRLGVLAGSLSGMVWVVSLEHEWVGLNVLESVVHKSTVASVVLLGAVNKLLLREGLECSSGKEHGSLD